MLKQGPHVQVAGQTESGVATPSHSGKGLVCVSIINLCTAPRNWVIWIAGNLHDLTLSRNEQGQASMLCSAKVYSRWKCLCKLFIQLSHTLLMAYFPYGTYSQLLNGGVLGCVVHITRGGKT